MISFESNRRVLETLRRFGNVLAKSHFSLFFAANTKNQQLFRYGVVHILSSSLRHGQLTLWSFSFSFKRKSVLVTWSLFFFNLLFCCHFFFFAAGSWHHFTFSRSTCCHVAAWFFRGKPFSFFLNLFSRRKCFFIFFFRCGWKTQNIVYKQS